MTLWTIARLNRRLAPDLYLDVVAITEQDDRAFIGGDGPVLDYAVRMRQFAAADDLPALLDRNAVDTAQIEALAELLASFHLSAAVAPSVRAPERTESMYDAVLGNLAQLQAHTAPSGHSFSLGRLVDWTHDAAQALESTFQLRERSGFIRECHGDLHAANIVRLRDRLIPFDCIEFDPRLRWIDVINDVAFLIMDLASHERADLALTLLNKYLEVTGDYDGIRVLPFYAVYRALVRANVDALTAEEVPARAAELGDRLRRRTGGCSGRWPHSSASLASSYPARPIPRRSRRASCSGPDTRIHPMRPFRCSMRSCATSSRSSCRSSRVSCALTRASPVRLNVYARRFGRAALPDRTPPSLRYPSPPRNGR